MVQMRDLEMRYNEQCLQI